MNTKNYREALSVAARFCSESEHCAQEVKDKLKRFELDEEELDTLCLWLVEQNYLNERRYAKAYTNDKIRFAKWGRYKIQYQLQLKHIPESLIREAFEGIDPDLYLQNLKELMVQKKRSVKSKTSYEFSAKLARFAQGRGYETELIRTVLKQYTDERDE